MLHRQDGASTEYRRHGQQLQAGHVIFKYTGGLESAEAQIGALSKPYKVRKSMFEVHSGEG
jgi:hypothetical protein